MTFLIHDLGLTAERATAVLDQVRLQGTATIPAVDISDNGAAEFGMTQLPSDEG